MRVDLHCHSTASDGSLSPKAVCLRAAERGVELLALTDHDTLAGFRRLREEGVPAGLRVLAGVEYSALWSGVGIHVVGLGVQPDHAATRFAENHQGTARERRAVMIGRRLERATGVSGACEGARALAGRAQVGRPHFARYLVAQGVVEREEEAFERWLGSGKTGDVKALWPDLAQVVGWIRAAGGVAVVAHPLKYKLTRMKLRALLREFRRVGGAGLEIVSGAQRPDETRHLTQLAQEFSLAGSCGSDFHGPGAPWRELGCASLPPSAPTPVWGSCVASARAGNVVGRY